MWHTPCRSSRGPRAHRCSWWHAHVVDSYRAARAAQDARVEAWAHGYATERSTYYREVEPAVTFRDWLLATAGASHPLEG